MFFKQVNMKNPDYMFLNYRHDSVSCSVSFPPSRSQDMRAHTHTHTHTHTQTEWTSCHTKLMSSVALPGGRLSFWRAAYNFMTQTLSNSFSLHQSYNLQSSPDQPRFSDHTSRRQCEIWNAEHSLRHSWMIKTRRLHVGGFIMNAVADIHTHADGGQWTLQCAWSVNS